MSCITTHTGKSVDPLNILPDDVDIIDVAHALSLLCRANGHLPHFYSVAQHSINCALEAKARGYSERVQLGCLLHDGSEAYLSDITRPVKPLLPNYLEIEKKVQNTIYDKWISPPLNDEELNKINDVDNAILYYEFLTMMNSRISDEPQLKSKPGFNFVDFLVVEREFTNIFSRLTGVKTCVGVDWADGKWLVAELINDIATVKFFDNISEICSFYEDTPEIIIDVPIGLPESASEALLRPDISARQYLKVPQRKSSVFNTPFRQMVYAHNKEEIWNLNYELDAKITTLSLGILPCIRQVDAFLQKNPEWKTRLVESHPECAFQSLNGDNGLPFSKHTDDGIALRCEILAKYVSNIDVLMNSIGKKRQNDMLDALCLAVTAKLGFKSITEPVCFDKLNIPMRIVVPK